MRAEAGTAEQVHLSRRMAGGCSSPPEITGSAAGTDTPQMHSSQQQTWQAGQPAQARAAHLKKCLRDKTLAEVKAQSGRVVGVHVQAHRGDAPLSAGGGDGGADERACDAAAAPLSCHRELGNVGVQPGGGEDDIAHD